MQTEDKKKVAETLTEQATKIKVGRFNFKIKPLTLAQIYELGALTNEMDSENVETEKVVNMVSTALSNYENAKILTEVFIISAFRSHWGRKLWGWYIRKHITVKAYEQFLPALMLSFNANFFLTSIIFLHQTTKITESQTTRRGQQLEE